MCALLSNPDGAVSDGANKLTKMSQHSATPSRARKLKTEMKFLVSSHGFRRHRQAYFVMFPPTVA